MTNTYNKSNTAWRNNGCVFRYFFVLLFFLLTLLPDYLLFREIGLDRQHSGRQRFGRRRDRRQRIVCALSSGGRCYVVFCSLLSSTYCYCFLVIFFLRRLTTCRLELGQTGPTRAATETRGETVGQQVRVVYMICSLLNILFFLLSLLLFHYVQYNNRRGWAGRNKTGADGAARQDGTGGQASGKRR